MEFRKKGVKSSGEVAARKYQRYQVPRTEFEEAFGRLSIGSRGRLGWRNRLLSGRVGKEEES